MDRRLEAQQFWVRDKYGSVSAHSTGAIYGALRAPYYHSNAWHASVRSLGGPPVFEWSVAKEVFAVPAGCACIPRRRGPPIKSRGGGALKTSERTRYPDCRMAGYGKKCARLMKSSSTTKDGGGYQRRTHHRKSILECEVTAYDLIRKNDNSVYSPPSVLVGGQRIFTDSLSPAPVCIPEPDYSDDEDIERDPTFTYSPPLSRKSRGGITRAVSKSLSSLLSEDVPSINVDSATSQTSGGPFLRTREVSPYLRPREKISKSLSSLLSEDIPSATSQMSGGTYLGTREEISKSMSSLLLEDVPSICDIYTGASNCGSPKHDPSSDCYKAPKTKPDESSSSDCSRSSSSEYPTWTSNELKSILKKKLLQELEEENREKKQVQFLRDEAQNAESGDTVSEAMSPNEGSEAIEDSIGLGWLWLDSPKEDNKTPSRSVASEEVLKSRQDETVLPSVDDISHEKEYGNHILTPDDTHDDIPENDYENLDPIYEELSDVSNSSKREPRQKSFFEGASKIDILSYLEDAKERGISELEEEEVITKNNLNHKEVLLSIYEDTEKEENVEASDETKSGGVERNDSGVGAETSKRLKEASSDWEEQMCADCDHPVEVTGGGVCPLVCRTCDFRRAERKEIIVEFVDTELKYGRDLRIIKEEFCSPMEIAGLLAKEQLCSIFLNLDELMAANAEFSEKLRDALDIATEHGDEDYTTVNLGKIFLESWSMLHAFKTYCVKQASASVLLSSLEKEKELLRIFLRVSQMENTLLRRMNLPAFLMVPVQRVTRYPLLLSRLHKVTPIHHKDRNALKEAQQKVELHLEHMNQQTKGVGGTKIWRRISNISASRVGKDIGSIKLRKMALEVLNWNQDETRFVIAGKLLFAPITDWSKKCKKFVPLHALLLALGKPNSNYRPESGVLFPRNTGIRDASLFLMKEKNARFIAVREPLHLGNCVISCDPECGDVFEVQEYTTKESYLLKGESKRDTREWLRQLRYHAKDLGSWRRRRNALANIMINGMIRH